MGIWLASTALTLPRPMVLPVRAPPWTVRATLRFVGTRPAQHAATAWTTAASPAPPSPFPSRSPSAPLMLMLSARAGGTVQKARRRASAAASPLRLHVVEHLMVLPLLLPGFAV